MRGRARELARCHGRPFLFAETACEDRVLRERLRQRAAGPSVSDATEELLTRMRAEFEAVTELPEGEHLVVDTTQPLESLAERVRMAVAGLGGRG
jgi:predicted kinase